MKKKQQQGTSKITLIVLVVAVVAILTFALSKKDATTSLPATQPTSTTISSDSDLMNASNDLDSTDVDGLDNELNQNDSDAASF
jgi:hypothetical protein